VVSAAGLPHLREYLRLPRVHSPDFKAQLSPLHAEVVLPRAPDVLIQRDDLANVTSLEHEWRKRAHPEFCRPMGIR